jgi:microsomal dipeptidase-like Zn-dependent dipeptidase
VELDVDHIAYMLEHVGEDGVGLGSEADRRQRLPPV